jgi:hypothetical protein
MKKAHTMIKEIKQIKVAQRSLKFHQKKNQIHKTKLYLLEIE